MLRALVVAVLALLLSPAGATAAPAPLATTSGLVTEGERSGQIRFRIGDEAMWFVADTAELGDPDAFWSALMASSRTGSSVTVRYDADAGFIDAATAEATFAVSELVSDGRTVASLETKATPTGAGAERRAAEAALARAVALLSHGEATAAREAAGTALAADGLEPRVAALALKTRANATVQEAEQTLPPGPARDALTVSALTDYEAWLDLAPGEADAAYRIAAALLALGAYDDSMAIYRILTEDDETDVFWAYIGLGAAYRARGETGKALAVLDQLVAAKGPQASMPYRYHRGWTLGDLGRLDEAEKELAEGLRSQAGYPWARIRRACMLARLGRLDEALAEQDQGVRLLREAQAKGAPSPEQVHELTWATGQAARLRAAAAADPKTKLDLACDSGWSDASRHRERSPLLALDWASRHADPEPQPAEIPAPEPADRVEAP